MLSDPTSLQSPAFLQRARFSYQDAVAAESETGDDVSTLDNVRSSQTIVEVSEPPSPECEEADTEVHAGPSVLANLLKMSPPQSVTHDQQDADNDEENEDGNQAQAGETRIDHPMDDATEQTPLLTRIMSGGRRSYMSDLEGQKAPAKRPWIANLVGVGHKMEERMTHSVAVAVNPSKWDRHAVWNSVVANPASCLPAVAVGLLLNILDALSYGKFFDAIEAARQWLTEPGMILFPLGKPIFSHLGSAGISVFYVSTIVSQIAFSSGSIFKGAVGSELVSTCTFTFQSDS